MVISEQRLKSLRKWAMCITWWGWGGPGGGNSEWGIPESSTCLVLSRKAQETYETQTQWVTRSPAGDVGREELGG